MLTDLLCPDLLERTTPHQRLVHLDHHDSARHRRGLKVVRIEIRPLQEDVRGWTTHPTALSHQLRNHLLPSTPSLTKSPMASIASTRAGT